MKEPEFTETQRFTQVWLWLVILAMSAFFLYSLIQQCVCKYPAGENAMPDSALPVMSILLGLGLPLFFLILNLTTKVFNDHIIIRFFPFHTRGRKILLADVVSCESRTYKPILEYGGWGIRYGLRGIAYNVKGNRGVELELKNGKRLLIGSQQVEELKDAINKAMNR